MFTLLRSFDNMQVCLRKCVCTRALIGCVHLLVRGCREVSYPSGLCSGVLRTQKKKFSWESKAINDSVFSASNRLEYSFTCCVYCRGLWPVFAFSVDSSSLFKIPFDRIMCICDFLSQASFIEEGSTNHFPGKCFLEKKICSSLQGSNPRPSDHEFGALPLSYIIICTLQIVQWREP